VAQAAAPRAGHGLPLLLLFPAALVIAVFLGSLAVTGANSISDAQGNWTLGHYERFLTDAHFLNYLWRSFRIAAYCTPVTLLLGYPFAYVMSRASPAVRLTLTLILVVQFFTSYIVRTYALILVLGSNGLLSRSLVGLGLLDNPLKLLFHEAGVAISLVLVPLPFMILPIYSVLKNIEPNLETAAASLGASRLKVFWFVIFPLSLPGVLAGVVLVFLFDLTAYIMPAMLGGGYVDMIANAIQEQAMAVLNKQFAAAMSMVLLAITALVLYLINVFGSRVSGEATG
jgi:putative spermidine/putrescine transport system permease protein